VVGARPKPRPYGASFVCIAIAERAPDFLMLICKHTRALQSKWELPSVEEREVSERDRQTLTILRDQRGAQVPDNHRCASHALANAGCRGARPNLGLWRDACVANGSQDKGLCLESAPIPHCPSLALIHLPHFQRSLACAMTSMSTSAFPLLISYLHAPRQMYWACLRPWQDT
jgi:hypothetical protein